MKSRESTETESTDAFFLLNYSPVLYPDCFAVRTANKVAGKFQSQAALTNPKTVTLSESRPAALAHIWNG